MIVRIICENLSNRNREGSSNTKPRRHEGSTKNYAFFFVFVTAELRVLYFFHRGKTRSYVVKNK